MTDSPQFNGLAEWMAHWWIDHLSTPPLVVIRCGRGDPKCRIPIGEIKSDGDAMMAMSRNDHPETTADWTPLAAPTIDELADEIAERDRQVLHRYQDGDVTKQVFKRVSWSADVAPVELMNPYYCKVHGEIEIDRERLAAFAASVDTRRPKRTFWAVRDID